MKSLAKNDKVGSGQGRVRFRIIEVDVDGGDSTILEGIKTLTNALGRSPAVVPAMRNVSQANGAVALSSGNGAALTEDLEESSFDEDPDEQETAPSRKTTVARKAPQLHTVPAVDWTSAPSLKDFVETLELDSNVRKYAAIFYWFKKHRGTAVITVDHIYSAYKAIGWSDLPKYASDTIRDIKGQRKYKWLDAGPNRGEYQLNDYGDQAVEKWLKTSK